MLTDHLEEAGKSQVNFLEPEFGRLLTPHNSNFEDSMVRAIKAARNNSVKSADALEDEAKEMEMRLLLLKETMAKEKQLRETYVYPISVTHFHLTQCPQCEQKARYYLA